MDDFGNIYQNFTTEMLAHAIAFFGLVCPYTGIITFARDNQF